jgi:hypothetical protein
MAIFALFIELVGNLKSIRIRFDHGFHTRVDQLNSMQVALNQVPGCKGCFAQTIL